MIAKAKSKPAPEAAAVAVTGILAVWNDCRQGREADYESWYVGQHLPERVAIAGFRLGRRYISIAARQPAYFTYYETDTPTVMRSSAYLARVNEPTPETRAIMLDGFCNMSRTVCRRAEVEGTGRGSFAVAARIEAGANADLARHWPLQTSVAGRLRTELWISDEIEDAEASAEERLRGKDRKIAACLFAEFCFEQDAARALAALEGSLGPRADIDAYRLLCSFDAADLRGRPAAR